MSPFPGQYTSEVGSQWFVKRNQTGQPQWARLVKSAVQWRCTRWLCGLQDRSSLCLGPNRRRLLCTTLQLMPSFALFPIYHDYKLNCGNLTGLRFIFLFRPSNISWTLSKYLWNLCASASIGIKFGFCTLVPLSYLPSIPPIMFWFFYRFTFSVLAIYGLISILTNGDCGLYRSIADIALQSRLIDESWISMYNYSCIAPSWFFCSGPRSLLACLSYSAAIIDWK